ncbi:TPA: hypothetical protein RUL95_003853 [Escherichia coli]|nr:hypothetical protein [Salmonella enterica subsp. enterica serovar Oranienburg]EIT3088146.1 hypothetical protein [Salmonella enterica subsp. enterica serovar Infantis]HCK0385943.1 hypothetical protein [Salmonella enterica]HDZ7227324.1 hypothetical protein [Escherichia coli]
MNKINIAPQGAVIRMGKMIHIISELKSYIKIKQKYVKALMLRKSYDGFHKTLDEAIKYKRNEHRLDKSIRELKPTFKKAYKQVEIFREIGFQDEENYKKALEMEDHISYLCLRYEHILILRKGYELKQLKQRLNERKIKDSDSFFGDGGDCGGGGD